MRALLVFAERDEDSGALFEQLHTNAVWKSLHLLICSKKSTRIKSANTEG